MAETEYIPVIVPELEVGVPDNGALFVFSNGAGKLFKQTRSQWLAFIAANNGVAKTTIDTAEGVPLTINWQIDIDPDPLNTEGLTYAQRHGFTIVPVVMAAAELDGSYVPYNTNFSYTGNGSGVLIVNIPDTFTGKLTII